jgi:FkbM family methyltransferase
MKATAMLNDLIKKIALRITPENYQLPLRYCYEKMRGRLEPEMFLLEEMIGCKKRAIDVGANYGLYSYFLSRAGKVVEAFEPLPECAQSIRAYGSTRICVHNVALSSTPGNLQLYTPIIDGVPYPACSTFSRPAGPCDIIDVPVKTLDSYGFDDVCLVKIDVEGHELEVLKGAEQTLNRERPVVLVEIEQRHLNQPITDVFDYLLHLGFSGHFIRFGKFLPLSEFSYDVHQLPYIVNVNDKDYVNNFFFTPI